MWRLSLDQHQLRSGAALGPEEYNRGDASRHVIFMNYAYAPGDEDGYYDEWQWRRVRFLIDRTMPPGWKRP